jgi:tetratricopeptide (TPR) repeat protein
MLKLPSALLAFGLISACGKSSEPVTRHDDAVPVSKAEATPPPPAPDAAPAKEDAAPAADTKPTERYLVWVSQAAGDPARGEQGAAEETTWLEVGADGKPRAVATRKQAVGRYGNTLWGLEITHRPFRETSCEDYDRQGEKAKPSRVGHLPVMRARGLAGEKRGEFLPIGRQGSPYFAAPQDEGDLSNIGEFWGRSLSLAGAHPGGVFVEDCQGAYSCGAHGDRACEFVAMNLATDAKVGDLEGAQKAIAEEAKAKVESWKAGTDMDEAAKPAVKAVRLIGNAGAPEADYVFVGETSYAGTQGDWSSYTASFDFRARIVPELGVSEVPAAVKDFLATQPSAARFGWTVIPADAPAAYVDELLAAFKDSSTLPAPAPADDKPIEAAGTDDVGKLIDGGRKLTRDKQYAEAIAAFDKAIAASDKAAKAWSGRGYAKLLAGDLDGADSDLKRALELDDTPKFQAAVYFNLGEIAEKRNDKPAAFGYYGRALALVPSDAVKKRLERLKTP